MAIVPLLKLTRRGWQFSIFEPPVVGIPDMSYSHMAFEFLDISPVENIGHKTHALKSAYLAAIMDSNTCGFLSPVLESVKCIVD